MSFFPLFSDCDCSTPLARGGRSSGGLPPLALAVGDTKAHDERGQQANRLAVLWYLKNARVGAFPVRRQREREKGASAWTIQAFSLRWQ